ncbi:hypothetical protein ACJX0J_023141, partial [Zea mays]
TTIEKCLIRQSGHLIILFGIKFHLVPFMLPCLFILIDNIFILIPLHFGGSKSIRLLQKVEIFFYFLLLLIYSNVSLTAVFLIRFACVLIFNPIQPHSWLRNSEQIHLHIDSILLMLFGLR